MRVRIDGADDLGVAKEARLALQYAGLILATYPGDADYVVALHEDPDLAVPVIAGADGALERDAVNHLATAAPRLVLDRSGVPNDCALTITIPPDDALRRAVSRALVEIFLTYIHHPAVPAPPAHQTPRTLAIAITLDRLVQHLLDTEPTEAQLARRLAHALAPPWWAFWRRP